MLPTLIIIVIIIIIIIKDNVYGAIATARVHPVHLDECRLARWAAANPPTKPTDLVVESACIGCDMTYIHHRHFIITQPES